MSPKVSNKPKDKKLETEVLEAINRNGLAVTFDPDSPSAVAVPMNLSVKGINITPEELLQILHKIFDSRCPVAVDVAGSLIENQGARDICCYNFSLIRCLTSFCAIDSPAEGLMPNLCLGL